MSGARCVEADLSRVRFCDCAGLNVLLGAWSRCRDAGVRFVVFGPIGPGLRLLHRSGSGSCRQQQ
ncbi:STAS domain-containing protein [Streptomyces sp. NPDC021056]|uniref:STAS domain-containing protein n=1 Tax=Streptomyces sp. NPDC021056 TaxID=3155012 RepID=UPI0033C2C11C